MDDVGAVDKMINVMISSPNLVYVSLAQDASSIAQSEGEMTILYYQAIIVCHAYFPGILSLPT